jgi:hypothetical protein
MQNGIKQHPMKHPINESPTHDPHINRPFSSATFVIPSLRQFGHLIYIASNAITSTGAKFISFSKGLLFAP